MMAESRPLYLLLCLIGAPLRLRRRYHAYPLLTLRCNRRLHMSANRKSRSSKLFGRSGPTYTPYHMMAESRPLYLLLCLIEGTSSTTATVPRRSIANRTRCQSSSTYMSCQSQITRSSKLFGRSGPTYTPYHMMVESRPLYLLLCLIEGTSSTTATVPRRSIAKLRCNRRLHMSRQSQITQ